MLAGCFTECVQNVPQNICLHDEGFASLQESALYLKEEAKAAPSLLQVKVETSTMFQILVDQPQGPT